MPEESRFVNVAGAVLTGGGSRRMGRDKSGIELGGVAAATRTARLLAGLFRDVLLVGGEPPPEAPGRRVPDSPGPRCALRGLVGALEGSDAERVVVLATDLPLLRAELLLALVAWSEGDAAVPRDAGGAHPLCAVYRRERVLPVARQRLERGELALSGLLEAVDTLYLEGADLVAVDSDGAALTNINTPEELDAVRERLAATSEPRDPAAPSAGR